jgi:hypothetical protein
LEAYSFIPKGGGDYKKIKVDNFQVSSNNTENIFFDDSKKTTVTFPSLVKNAKTRMEYTLKLRDAHFLGAFYFQNYLPAKELLFEVEAPNDMELDFVYRGRNTEIIKKEVDKGRNRTTYKFYANNVANVKPERMTPSVSYYLPHIIPIIKTYKDGLKYLGGPDDLYDYYFDFIRDINKREDEKLKTITLDLVKNAKTELEKGKLIYKWVQDNIKYVAFEDGMGGFVPREAKDVCSKRYGDCKDLSSILVEMYKYAGLKSYYTWVGTKHIPYTYKDVPTPAVDNHMICTVELDGKIVIVDGTMSEVPFGTVPQAIQGKECMIGQGKDKYQIYTAPIMPASLTVVYDTTYLNINGNKVEGDISINYTGYSAWDLNTYYKMYGQTKKDEFIKARTSRGNNKFIQEKGEVYTTTEGDRSIQVKTKFHIDDYIQTAGDETFINLNLIQSFSNQKIDEKEQTFDVDNQFANTDKQIVYFTIPNGYDVSYMPPNKQNEKQNHWKYMFDYKKVGNTIVFEKYLQYDLMMIPSNKLKDHNQFINELLEQYNENIILKKKS